MVQEKPNIVIISMDAVRGQNLPFYGYHRNTTPFLASMEKDLAIFENAISSSYWTMPSVASLFTGMYTSGHGLAADGDKLDKSFSTLPKVLRSHGYRCGLFVRNVYVSEYSALNSDFHDFYREYQVDHLKKLASRISRRGLARLQPPGINRVTDVSLQDGHSKKDFFSNIAARAVDVLFDTGGRRFISNFSTWLKTHRKRPFFAYFHFLETHTPYRAPLKFAYTFLSVRDNIKKLFINHDHLKYLLNKSEMSLEDFRILVGAYDNSIRYLDYLMEEIVRRLKRYQVYDNTLLIILSDHGDNIGDHGLMFHYWCLYDTLIKIPLIMKFPDGWGIKGRIPEVVQNVDIFPMILSMLNERHEEIWEQIQGNDLLKKFPPRREHNLAISELVKPFGPDRKQYRKQFSRFDRRLLSVRTQDLKFIYSSRGDHESYDLSMDPAESLNLYPAKEFSRLEEQASKYYIRMDEFYQRNRQKIDGEVGEEDIDEAVVERLKALGYM